MRLIDADKMKETLISGTKNKFVFVCLSRVLEKIDNAPTVEIGEDGIDIEKYSDKLYKIAYEKGKAEAERPQGEWIDEYLEEAYQEYFHTCSICKEEIEKTCYDNFCPNCGAKMG